MEQKNYLFEKATNEIYKAAFHIGIYIVSIIMIVGNCSDKKFIKELTINQL